PKLINGDQNHLELEPGVIKQFRHADQLAQHIRKHAPTR
ncbi:MAG: hypothetical protein RL756_1940, partial [Pseudomonadota bacterium]